MTNRTIDSVTALSSISFDDTGLVPVVAQDGEGGAVLMVAWANREALEKSLVTGQLHFWSRSRRSLWRKGETSGNTLEISSLHADCDGDTVLALVRPSGPACHTGEQTCFGEIGGAEGKAATTPGDERSARTNPLQRLDDTLRARAEERPEGSYTVRLLDDPNLRLKKIGEETAELVAALATGDRDRAVEEAADVLYHAVVALRAEGIGIDALLAELDRRAG